MNGQERPTTPSWCDVSTSGPRTSAAPASHVGYRGFVIHEDRRWHDGCRVEPCACGGDILQYLGESVSEVVELHNASEAHQSWRRLTQ